ncbi:alanine racemase [Rivularia sp. PCC 7116]|uniref:alanine racemase n=1 Tax=Rivularia sp. PCC 7116 TaxID=373994 RepID=UPI00029F1F69|nr:alanine racemase [Rivularia sp. PCC 7116]AFY59095.1 alanine racemase [Rivularia sp. PCC 7116]
MLSHEQNKTVSSIASGHTYDWVTQRAWVEINLAALANNIVEIRKLLQPQTKFMAVVKADAYGHGAVSVARTALKSGANCLGVATVPEGIQLREAGIKVPILILGATNTPEQVKAIVENKLEPTICSAKQALIFSDVLETINFDSTLTVHLKLDTGMSRLGTNWQDCGEFVQLVASLPHLNIGSVYSHLATADSPDKTVMDRQHRRFDSAIATIKNIGIEIPCLHLANSAGTLSHNSLHYDMVRVGLAIYGFYPSVHLQDTVDLQPVLQVKARVTHVKTIEKGAGVSYGHKFIASKKMRIAVVGIGYADGIPRNLSNNMQVLIGGVKVPQIGAITMDQIMLDVSSISDVQENEIVTILGNEGNEKITAEDWAHKLNTISWEILCSFKHRLPRINIM